jgi:signal transduction histidine kinase
LLGLVDDLSFATMFESGNFTNIQIFNQVNLIELVSSTVKKLASSENFDNKSSFKYEFQIDQEIANLIVNVDARLMRVLHHLLSNAFRYGDENYPLVVSITSSSFRNEISETVHSENFVFKITNRIKK